MEGQACPRCKTTKYRNPSLKLMVNVCGHTLCDKCVDLLFLKGSGSCPECHVPLRRNNFRVQLFEDPMVEKEVDIRRRILRDYNKKEDDFETLAEYNNYLEEIEDIIYKLCNNIDIVNTNKRIEQFKRENREIIQRNKMRLGREECELENLLEMEKAQEEARKLELMELENEQKKKKAKTKEDLIEELMLSGKDAAEIVSEFAERAEKIREEEKNVPPPKSITELSSNVKYSSGSSQMFKPIPKADEGPLYKYEPIILEREGPNPLNIEEIEAQGYLANMRLETPLEKAGGFKSALACKRALEEALIGLFYNGAEK